MSFSSLSPPIGKSTYCIPLTSPWHTLYFPLRVPPYSAGWEWPLHPLATREGGPGEGVVVGDGDDALTDDEEGGGGWVDGME